MLIKPTEEERIDQQGLIMLDKIALSDINQAYRVRDLLFLRRMLVSREQDAWLLRFALVHEIPTSKIKDFQFTKQGEVLVGDDHESTTSIRNEEVGSRRGTGVVQRATQNDQAGDQSGKTSD
jgi:hypothetical protein